MTIRQVIAVVLVAVVATSGVYVLLDQRGDPSGPSAADARPGGDRTQGGTTAGRAGVAAVDGRPAPAPAPSPTAAPPFMTAPPELGAAEWVQNFRATRLWSAPEPDGGDLGEAPQWSYFQFRGESSGARIMLVDPGDGVRRIGGPVWAAVDDFGPSGLPPVEWYLGVGASERQLPAVPSRQLDEWPPAISGHVAVVMDSGTGAVLFGKNPRRRVAMASLTKMITAIVAIERGRLDDRVTVDVDGQYMAINMESTVMGLDPGDNLSLETLLYGLMLPSGNDAAVAIARHIGGTEERFVEMLNAKVRELGLEDTQLRNPHGLDAAGHYSTAYDQAVIARYGLRMPAFAKLAAAKHWEADGFSLWNTNRLLWNYPGADGVKPGFTDEAGSALVSSATRGGRQLIVSVIRANSAAFDSVPLLDWGFRAFRWGA